MAAELKLDDDSSTVPIRLGLPKGRMKDQVLALLNDAGIKATVSDRGYRPSINIANFQVKMLKPQNILEMLSTGSRDIGFGGEDWVENLGLTDQLVELMDTRLDPVRIVVAAPREDMLSESAKTGKKLLIASEYEVLTANWIKRKGINASVVRTFGATESFPPEDADMICDNTATGSTLAENGLKIIDTVMTSSTRLFASKEAFQNPAKRKRIDAFVLLLRAALEGRGRQMLEFNVSNDLQDQVIRKVPCMRAPTVSQLHGGQGYAVKVVVRKDELPTLLPNLKSWGATDIIVSDVRQIIL